MLFPIIESTTYKISQVVKSMFNSQFHPTWSMDNTEYTDYSFSLTYFLPLETNLFWLFFLVHWLLVWSLLFSCFKTANFKDLGLFSTLYLTISPLVISARIMIVTPTMCVWIRKLVIPHDTLSWISGSNYNLSYKNIFPDFSPKTCSTLNPQLLS